MKKIFIKRKYIKELLEWENTHWWHLGRRRILVSVIRSETSEIGKLSRKPSLLDIGCGAGKIAFDLSSEFNILGIDNTPIAIEISKKVNKGNNAKFILGQADKINLGRNKFNVIISFDVLEHIKNDIRALGNWNAMLKKGGKLIIAVPAFNWMWGIDDELASHYRRYSKGELYQKLIKSNYKVRRITYFNFFLFPIAAVVRFFKRIIFYKENMSGDNLFKNVDFRFQNKMFNKLLLTIFSFEENILKKHSLPFGVSLLAVCEKK